jgi:nucleoside-diphosphate-sugar epimerase
MANVAVTGGAGRLGRLAVDELRSSGHEVTSIDRVAWAGPERAGVTEVVTDLGDPRATAEAVHAADVIVHLAAQLMPVESCLSENQESTWNVLMAAARGGGRRVVYASSVYAFGHHCGFTTEQFPAAPQIFSVHDVLAVRSFPITEQDEPAPRDSYSVSKRLNELTAEAVALAHGIEVVGLRFGDIWFEALRDWWKSPPVPERPEPGRKFDFWNYVDAGDAARAIRCAVEASDLPRSSTVFVMADDTQVRDTTRAAIASALPELEGLLPASFDARQSLFSNRHAEALLGWRPQVSWTDFEPVGAST